MKTQPESKQFLRAPWSECEFPHADIIDIGEVYLDHILPENKLTAVILDCETASEFEGSGISLGIDTVIEITLVKITIDRNAGIIYSLDSVLSQLNEPSFQITDETTEITGITQEIVSGKRFNHELTKSFLNGVELVLAHNAGFDRPMVEGLTTQLSNLLWACTCKGDINWRDHGYSSSGLEYLVFKQQAYYSAHRAAPDCFALLHLLRCQPNALYEILQSANSPKYNVVAANAPYNVKDELKAIGMRPLYINGKFKHWEINSLSEHEAKQFLAQIEQLYPIDFNSALFKVETKNRYSLA